MTAFLALAPSARTLLYGVFLLCSLLAFSLAAALISVGVNISGYNHQPSAELLVTSLLAVAIVTPLHLLFHRRPSTHVLSTVWVELVVLGVLNLLFLGGAAAMATQVRGSSYCAGYTLCGVDDALQAFSWLAWITSILIISLVIVAARMEKRPEIWKEQFAVGRTQLATKDKETPAEAGDVQMGKAQVNSV